MLGVQSEKIKVFLVDDHPILRRGIANLIQDETDIDVCGESGTVNDAMAQITRLLPDVVIVDIKIDDENSGIDLVKAIKERCPGVASLILSMYEEYDYAERAIRAGAKGYIQKKDAPKKIIEAIRDVRNGKLSLSESIADNIINKVMYGVSDKNGINAELLSNRELEVFELLGQGCKNKKIAAKLNLSYHTVGSHIRNIKKKLKISNNNELIIAASQRVARRNS
ncbi:MAG: response regulator transcription factor [bacterium]|nr:response regulator transcription factor [bacterium]